MLLQYQNMPSAKDGLSPAQTLVGHPVQDTIPAHPRSFTSEWQKSAEEVESRREVTQQNAERYYNRTAHPLPDIKQDSQVISQLDSEIPTLLLSHICHYMYVCQFIPFPLLRYSCYCYISMQLSCVTVAFSSNHCCCFVLIQLCCVTVTLISDISIPISWECDSTGSHPGYHQVGKENK